MLAYYYYDSNENSKSLSDALKKSIKKKFKKIDDGTFSLCFAIKLSIYRNIINVTPRGVCTSIDS